MKHIILIILLIMLCVSMIGDVSINVGGTGDVSISGGVSINGLVGYWSLDESNSSGTAIYDLSGNGNTGTSANSPTFSDDQNGVANQAMVFDGSSDVVDPNMSIASEPHTISFWMKSNDINSDNQICGIDSFNGMRLWIMWGESAGNFVVTYRDSGKTYRYIIGTYALSTEWINFCYTNSGTNQYIYVNGVDISDDTYTYSGFDTACPFVIGSNVNGYFNGSLSDLKIYNVAWTAAEVLNDYNAGRHTAKMKLGGDLPTMVFTADGTDDDFAGTIRGNSGDYVVFNWGDGTDTKYDLLGIYASVAISHTYSSYGDYTITIYNGLNLTTLYVNGQANLGGDVSSWSALTNLTGLYCYSTSIMGDVSSWSALINLTNLQCYSTSVSGDVSSWSALTNLTLLRCYLTSISGDISSWSALTNLTILSCNLTSVEGDVSSWSVLTNLNQLRCSSTSISGDISSWSALTNLTILSCNLTSVTYTATTLPDWDACEIQVQDCGWDSTMVDAFLCDLNASSTASTKSLNISGTNAAPTATGLACEAALETKGWAVTVTGE